MSLPPDPFGRVRLPGDFTRAGRVRLLKEAADALVRGEAPPAEAALWLGGALQAWLANGKPGELERRYLHVRAPRGCHHTPQAIAASLIGNEREPG